MKWTLRFAFIVIVALGACAPRDVTVTRDTWTDTNRFAPPDAEIFRHQGATVVARPIIMTKSSGTLFGVLLQVNRTDANGPRIEKVTLAQTALDYRKIDRLLTQCDSRCQRSEFGVIALPEGAFTMAERTGLPLRIWGQRGRYSGTVPAALFRDTLAKWDQAH